MLEQIKLLLGITTDDKDDLLSLLIAQATEEALNFTHRDILNDRLMGVIRQMVVYNYNRLGTEGVDSENYSGVGFSYSADYPEGIKRQLINNRKVITI